MKKLMLIIVGIALLIGSFTIAAYAFGPDGRGGKDGGWFKSLNLTADQQLKLKTIRQDFQKDTQNLRQDMQKKLQELRKLWSAENPDQAAIDAKTKETTTLRIQMTQKSREMFTKMKPVLTPEQIKQLEAKQQDHGKDQEKGQGRHHRGMRGGENGCPGFGQ